MQISDDQVGYLADAIEVASGGDAEILLDYRPREGGPPCLATAYDADLNVVLYALRLGTVLGSFFGMAAAEACNPDGTIPKSFKPYSDFIDAISHDTKTDTTDNNDCVLYWPNVTFEPQPVQS